ncbi:sulfur carrier protein ThiS [Blastococcus aggregatus]|uniref:sulfur carrier protein ThiS n=1 Tax=Blastococcus aggregatus TaxID=38502 RepID=UPI001FE26483|nr:sulfur carrier protein ThiS [Blastococcus aggregatus]
MTVQVTVNGVATDVAEDTSVAALVAERGGRHDRIAVARNGDVVPRSGWAATRLAPGDDLEILAPTAGG